MDGWLFEKLTNIDAKLDYLIQELQRAKQGDTEDGKKKKENKGPTEQVPRT